MSHVLNDRCIDKMLTRRETAVFMDEPACRGEKVNRYDSPSGNVLSLKQGFKGFVIFFFSSCVCCLFSQGDIGPAGAPGTPGKEGLVGPKVRTPTELQPK